MSAKKSKSAKAIVQSEALIHIVRGRRVMLGSMLAELYGVATGQLNRAVQRNAERFPEDFMFQLTAEEVADLKCQIGISKKVGRGGSRARPYVFTQEGIAMLSSVLRSPRAIEMNIAIMRAFVRLRQMALSVEELAYRVENLERGYGSHAQAIRKLLDRMRNYENPPDPPNREMGFHVSR